MKFKEIINFALGPLGSAFLGFISLPILTWLYTPEDIGKISLLTVIASVVILGASFGLDQAFVREYHSSKSKPLLFKLVFYPGLLLISLVGIFFIYHGGWLSELLFKNESRSTSFLIVLYIFAAYINRFLSLILRMEGRGIAFSMSQLLPKIIVIFGVFFLYFFELTYAFNYLLACYVVSVFIVMLSFSYNTRAVLLGAISQTIDWKKQRALFKFGAPLILGSIAYWGLTASDKIFIQYYMGHSELGIYSVAISLAAAATIIQSVFSTVWMPMVYEWVENEENLDRIDEVRTYLLLVVVLIFCIAGLLSRCVNIILPDEYNQVPYLLVVCLTAPFFYTLSETTVVGLGVTRKSSLSMLASVLAFVFNLLGNYLLIPKLGIEGAAFATAVSFWLFLILRTEFASLVWRPIRKIKLYSYSFIVMTASILFMFFGKNNFWLSLFLWACIFLLFIYLERKIIFLASSYFLRKQYKKRKF